jgi:ATP-independent RNA helicase DbpA
MVGPEFKSLNLNKDLTDVLSEIGITQMTPIQAQAIPLMLNDKDLIGQSQTGSGKTMAFALPILQRIDLENKNIQALVLCPTRELTNQVAKDFRKLARKMDGLQVLTVTGGQPGQIQAQSLRRGVHIVIGTPGRILDQTMRGRMNYESLKTFVLDEADEMLDMGFEHDLQEIMNSLPSPKQTVFFSATFPEKILSLSQLYQKSPQQIVIEKVTATAPQIEQFYYQSENEEKSNTLMRALQQHPSQSTIVFCNQKATVAAIGLKLQEMGVSCGALHGDLEQRDRDRVMTLFRNGSYRILVATDVAARGLDISDLEMVVNFDLPTQPEIYVHRIGRTGRMGKKGCAVSLVTAEQVYDVFEIEKYANVVISKGTLGFKNQHGLNPYQFTSNWQSLLILAGRKDKIRPGDILGALTGSPNGVSGSDVGKIDVQDQVSYVAVVSAQVNQAISKLRRDGIKKQKITVQLVK